jgi:hypothetical protein
MSSGLALETLGATIKAHIAKGGTALDKAEDHYRSAGLHLIEAKERLRQTNRDENGKRITWPIFLTNHCEMLRSRANELIRLANGQTTLADMRADARDRVARHRAKTRPLRNGGIHAADPIEEPCTDCDTPQEYWQRSLSNLAGNTIAMPAYWTREFGEWEKFERPSSLRTLTRQAANALTKLADDLEGQPGALGQVQDRKTTARPVNEFHRELLRIGDDLEKRLGMWVAANQQAEREAKATIFEGLWLLADRLNKLAQRLDATEPAAVAA